VAVEANPRLVAAGRAAFADAIDAGRLVLLGAGLISHELPPAARLPFYRSTENDVWSSFAPEWGCRHADGSPASVADTEHCRAVAVPTTTCDALIRDYGTPFMLKVCGARAVGFVWAGAVMRGRPVGMHRTQKSRRECCCVVGVAGRWVCCSATAPVPVY